VSLAVSPGYEDAGTYEITIIASDGLNSSSDKFILTIQSDRILCGTSNSSNDSISNIDNIVGPVESTIDDSRPIEVRNPKNLPSQLEAKRIFLGKGYKPSLALLPDGELIIITSHSEGSGSTHHNFNAISRSSDNGVTWEPWRRLKCGPEQDLLGKEQWITVIDDGIADNDDILFVTSMFISSDIANTFGYSFAVIGRSTDGGQSWVQTKIGPTPNGNPITLSSRNIIKMADGTLLFGAGQFSLPGTHSYIYSSRDQGVTWQASDRLDLPSYINFENEVIAFQNTGGFFAEAWLRLDENNALHNTFRLAPFNSLFPMDANPPTGSDQPSRIIKTTSIDGGITWSNLTDASTLTKMDPPVLTKTDPPNAHSLVTYERTGDTP
jgi:hypothetical protein